MQDMNHGGGDGYSIAHDSGPYTPPLPPPSQPIYPAGSHPAGTESIYAPSPAQGRPVAPPPPTPAATVQRHQLAIGDTPTVVREQPGLKTNIDIEGAIAKSVTDFIDDSNSFGTSLLRGIRHTVVPFATVMDLTSAVLRFLTLSFLLLLPELYNNIFTPPPHALVWQIAHYAVLITSVLGIAVGVPVALFSAVFSLVSLLTRRESVYTMTSRKARNERLRYFKQKIRGAWTYIMVAFIAGAFISVPYFTSQDTSFPAGLRQVLSEVSFILVPLICTIVTMITERETGADMVEGGTRVGIGLGMFTTFEAGMRLAQHIGSHVDAAAIRNAMNGDIGGAIEAGVAESPTTNFLTLSDIAEMLGRSPAKDDPFRRTLNNIVGAAYRKGTYGVDKHPIKGYLVPEEHFAELFKKYTYNRPAAAANNVVALKTVKTTTSKNARQDGLLARIWHVFVGTPAQQEITTTREQDSDQRAS